MDRILKLLAWPASLFIAYIFLWYEQYKLTGDPGSVELFTILTNGFGLNGYEKPVRLGVATAEITASILVVLPWTRVYGAILAFGIISGAMFFHLVYPLGIDPIGDGGALFAHAVQVWLCAAFVLVAWRREVSVLIHRVTG
ncbi:MAG: hypothetical protein H7251_16455, partial [Acetobacteraceae bacterium]|nr:hypothetical protein [Acetobacteraceae bacterium]